MPKGQNVNSNEQKYNRHEHKIFFISLLICFIVLDGEEIECDRDGNRTAVNIFLSPVSQRMIFEYKIFFQNKIKQGFKMNTPR